MYNSKVAELSPLEADLRKFLGSCMKRYWHSFVEPAVGSTMGAADMSFLFPGANFPMPVEVKTATVLAGTPRRLRPSKIRPVQILWHEQLARHGGLSCFLMGVPVPKPYRGFKVYALGDCSRHTLLGWKDGFLPQQLVKIIDPIETPANIYYLNTAAWKAHMMAHSRHLSPVALGQPHQPSAEPAGAPKRAAL